MRRNIIFSEEQSEIEVTFKEEPSFYVDFDGAGRPTPQAVYDGSYSVIPSRTEQVLQTKEKVLLENIVVAPIPQNYGLVTYDGFGLTIT